MKSDTQIQLSFGSQMGNERITEGIVRDHFKQDPLFQVIKLEEQKSNNRKITELLQNASKSGTGNVGKPEFLITFPTQNTNYVIVIECKAKAENHKSKNLDKPKDFAVDGALHYAKIFAAEYDVIVIAASGQEENNLIISTFKWNKNDFKFTELPDKKLLTINDYIKLFDNEQFSDNLKTIDIITKAVHLNEAFQDYSITEYVRCTIISAVLLALLDDTFRQSYSTYKTSQDLGNGLIEALKIVLRNSKVRSSNALLSEFQKIVHEPLFTLEKLKPKKGGEKQTIEIIKTELIDYIKKNVYPLMKMDGAGMDVLGRFYTEFIRYAGSSQKQGLVLTPFHVTDLFCDLADITSDSVVYDPCCGSGGFLISAMKRMLSLAGNNTAKKNNITSNQLIGIEIRPDMFTYACSNMTFRGNGKSNIYNGNCFSMEDQIIADHNTNVVFLNPPYDVGNARQMEFIEHGLRVVSKNNGIVVAIVQMSCAIKDEKELKVIKERLLQNHRLKAVISMPDELFYPVGVITCIMVWESNKPNKGFETWFGYLKDDGFEKRKHKGRIDAKKKWNGLKGHFLNAYRNSKEVAGLSVTTEITAMDEWCAEAYMETDYSTITETDFIKTIQSYYAFKYITNG